MSLYLQIDKLDKIEEIMERLKKLDVVVRLPNPEFGRESQKDLRSKINLCYVRPCIKYTNKHKIK